MIKTTIKNSPHCAEMEFPMFAFPVDADKAEIEPSTNAEAFEPWGEEFKKIRTLDINGELWFVGKDICALFGDKNHKRSLGRIDDEDKKKVELDCQIEKKCNKPQNDRYD